MRTLVLSFLILLLAFNTKAQLFGGKFEPGYYYDINGQKVEGLIDENTSGRGPIRGEGYIEFKENSKAEKQKLSASMIHGFVVAQDSFVVAHAPRTGPWSNYELDFLRVVVNAPTKLYTITGGSGNGGGGFRPGISTGLGIGGGFGSGIGLSIGSGGLGGGGGSKPVYYYGSETNSITELKKQNFIEVMSEVMADEPEAVEQIKNKKYKYGDMEKLVKYYNQLREGHTNQ